jgi:hypothetical protein
MSDELDLEASLDIVNFATENVFVEGQSLDEMFPQVDAALDRYEKAARQKIDQTDFSGARLPSQP